LREDLPCGIHQKLGLRDPVVKQPGGHALTFSRRVGARALQVNVPQDIEGAGKAGCSPHPQPRVQMKKAHEQVTTGTPRSSGLPCAMVYGLFCALPGVHDLFSHRRPRNAKALSANLAPAKGCQNHAASPSAPMLFVEPTPSRPPHPASRVVTIAIRPSHRGGTARTIRLILASEKQNFFLRAWLDRNFARGPDGQITLRRSRKNPRRAPERSRRHTDPSRGPRRSRPRPDRRAP
jgi:hypothetical protein